MHNVLCPNLAWCKATRHGPFVPLTHSYHCWLSDHSIVKLFGAKEKAMHLIEHNNPEVARYALQCVSKVRT